MQTVCRCMNVRGVGRRGPDPWLSFQGAHRLLGVAWRRDRGRGAEQAGLGPSRVTQLLRRQSAHKRKRKRPSHGRCDAPLL